MYSHFFIWGWQYNWEQTLRREQYRGTCSQSADTDDADAYALFSQTRAQAAGPSSQTHAHISQIFHTGFQQHCSCGERKEKRGRETHRLLGSIHVRVRATNAHIPHAVLEGSGTFRNAGHVHPRHHCKS